MMAQKAEEYGSHNKTFEIASEINDTVTDNADNKILEHTVETGDIKVKGIPIQD